MTLVPIPSLDAILNAIRVTLLPAKPFDPDSFTLGEIIPVKGVRSLDSQRVLIQVKGRELVAETTVPLPEGAEFQARVEQLEPRVIFKFLMPASGDSVSFSLLKKYWVGDPPLERLVESWEALENPQGPSLPKEVQETWTRIRETVKLFSGMLESGADPQALARIIDQSGLNLENKLLRIITSDGKPFSPDLLQGDLKGLLLKMRAQVERAAPETARELQPLIQKIELYQLLNAGEGDPSKLLLLIPLLFPEGLRWTEVLFSGDRGGRESAGDRESGLLFLLDLPALGKLQVEIQIHENRLHGRFKTPDPRIGKYLEENMSRLADRLRLAGYGADIEIRVVDPKQLQEILPARLEGFPDSLVSLLV
jgi:hypothetical protein